MILAREQLAYPLPQKKQQVARPKRKLARAHRLKLSGLVLLGFVLGLTVVLCQTRITCISFRLQELQKEMAQVEAENGALDSVIQRLSTPERIEAVAVQRLGMIRPPEEAIRVSPAAFSVAQASTGPEKRKTKSHQVEESGWLKPFLEMLAQKSSSFLNGQPVRVIRQVSSPGTER